jgi:isopropylmalate/homocitrate/citramalate synthase
VLEAVIAKGATTINIPDTVGYAVPELYGEFIRNLRERIPNSTRRSGRCTATTTWAWRWPTRWPA